MIKIVNLEKNYWMDGQKNPILNIDHLVLKKGDRVCLTGRSGCGKSTLLHIIGGVLKSDTGSIKIDGQEICRMQQSDLDKFRFLNIGYIFQDFHLIPSLTAEENVSLMLPKHGKRELDHLLNDWFSKVGLEGKRKHKPSQLSRGQQQRIAIIRAFIHKPTIILADEPTGSLDFETGDSVMELMLRLSEENNQTLLCVTHDLNFASKFPKIIDMTDINTVIRREEKPA